MQKLKNDVYKLFILIVWTSLISYSEVFLKLLFDKKNFLKFPLSHWMAKEKESKSKTYGKIMEVKRSPVVG